MDWIVNIARSSVASICVLLSSELALAENRPSKTPAPHNRGCQEWRSSEEFVGSSLNYCLKTGNQRLCQRASEHYFSMCGFQGDFDKILANVTSKLLVMMVINQATVSPAEKTKEF